MRDFAAVVLAGGAARRMGGAIKPTLAVGGVSLLSRVLTAVARARHRVVVGPPELGPLLPRGVRLTREDPPGGGPVAASAAGLDLLAGIPDAGRVALLAGDLPFLSPEVITALLRAVVTDVDGAVLVDGTGAPQWLCGAWRIGGLRARLAVLRDPDGRSVRDLIEGLRIAHVRGGDPTRPPPWLDCDTDQDLRRAEEWADGDAG